MNEREFNELAAGHVLNALSPSDEARFLQALNEHPEWEAVAATDAATVADLAETVAPEMPAPSVREALLAQIAVTPQHTESAPPADVDTSDADASGAQSVPSASTERGGAERRSPLRFLFALAAGLVLLVGLGVGAVALNDQLNRPASVIALERIEAAADAGQASVTLPDGTTATAHWSAELGAAVLVTDGLDPLNADETYQLWFVRGETPVPAGLFAAAGAKTTALLDGEMHSGDVIAVTVEPAGGSPSGLPTSDPIIVIPTA